MRGATSTSVTDNECAPGAHTVSVTRDDNGGDGSVTTASVTDRAQLEADERNRELRHLVDDNPSLAVLSVLGHSTAGRVISDWAMQSADICTSCHENIEPGEVVVITGELHSAQRRVEHRHCHGPYFVYNRFTTCGHCDRPMFLRHVGRLAYCCHDCRDSEERERRHRRLADRDRTCQHCDQPFTGRADARYCSTRCRVAAHRAKAPRPLRDSSATSATPQHPTPSNDPVHPQHPQHRNTDGQP